MDKLCSIQRLLEKIKNKKTNEIIHHNACIIIKICTIIYNNYLIKYLK